MGKRKSTRKPVVRKRVLLDASFLCPFCNHERSVECQMDRSHNIGTIRCRVCGAQYQSNINYLSEPVDVYADWIDACDALHKKKQKEILQQKAATSATSKNLGDDDERRSDMLQGSSKGKLRAVHDEDDSEDGVALPKARDAYEDLEDDD